MHTRHGSRTCWLLDCQKLTWFSIKVMSHTQVRRYNDGQGGFSQICTPSEQVTMSTRVQVSNPGPWVPPVLPILVFPLLQHTHSKSKEGMSIGLLVESGMLEEENLCEQYGLCNSCVHTCIVKLKYICNFIGDMLLLVSNPSYD